MADPRAGPLQREGGAAGGAGWHLGGRPATGAESKIGAIGVRVTRWVSWHGVALNVEPDLAHFGGSCRAGCREIGVTSLAALGIPATMDDADVALRAAWDEVFETDAGAVCDRA